ncbi:MAG: tetratricopeptide repeat-containing sensor histidine kinase [Anaerolinea sp.]|nr:tetratricopeptide repeat-containing sensor histidine kinase [Anaerolinea sp.]
MLGQVAEASAAFYNGLQLAETLGAVFEQGMMCDGLGTLYQDMGDYEQSRAYMEKGAQFFQQIGDTYWLTVTYQGLGSIHEDLGLYEESLAYGQKALALSRSERYPKLEAMALYGVGLAHFRLQNYEMALIFLAESETLARELERLDITAVANLTIGQLHLAQGADGLALEPLQTAVSLAQTVQFLRPQIEAHRDLSLAHRRLANWQQALTHFEAFHQLAAQMLDQEKVHQLTEMRTRYDAERHQRENELYRLKNVVLAQKNEELQALYQEKDEVLAIVAHDLKSPLNAILLSSELLSYRLANSEQEELRGSAQNITRAALIMTEIIQHLLTSNRIETGQIEVKRRPCSLADLIKQLLDMEGAQAQKKQITLTTTLPDDDTITTDVQLLAEALTNLVSNAIKYSPPANRGADFSPPFRQSSVYCRSRPGVWHLARGEAAAFPKIYPPLIPPDESERVQRVRVVHRA